MPAERKRFYKRWWFLMLVALFLPTVGAGVYYDIRERAIDAAALDEAMAEADRLFPNDWRIDDLLAKMPPPTPPNENPLRVMAAWAKGDIGFTVLRKNRNLMKDLASRGPTTRLDDDLSKLFRHALLEEKDALDVMEPYRTARDAFRPLDWQENYLHIPLGHADSIRTLAIYNVVRAAIELEEGKTTEAVESLLAIHHSLSWLHREPVLMSQLCRTDSFAIEFDLLERILGQAELSPEVLKSLSSAIEAEVRVDPVRVGFRADAGTMDRLLEAIFDGRVDLENLMGKAEESSPKLAGSWFFRYYGKRNRASMLREMIAMRQQLEKDADHAETARYFEDLGDRLGRKRDEGDRTYVMASTLFPGVHRVYAAKLRFVASGRLAVAALAAERYRIDRKKWPAKWEDLTPKYLPSPPIDPWTGEPLKLKRHEKGILIYAVGADLEDDDGDVDRTDRLAAGSDLGFELFDPEHRRQPAPPKQADPDDKE
jgi:hypothetical protein